MMYLDDVNIGGTEFVLGSEDYKNDQGSFSSDEIKSLGPIWTANGISAGTTILYDYRLIHRASPVKNKYHKRLSLFGQFSSSNIPTGEPIALLAEDLKNISQKQASVLNFGIPSSAPNWPIKSAKVSSPLSFLYRTFYGFKQSHE